MEKEQTLWIKHQFYILMCTEWIKNSIYDYGPLIWYSLKDVISSHLLYSDLCTDHIDLR